MPLGPGAANVLHDIAAVKSGSIQEPQCGQRLLVGSPGDLPVLDQIQQVSPDRLRSQDFRAFTEVPGKAGHVVDVKLDRFRGQVPQFHVLDHALPQWSHHWTFRETEISETGKVLKLCLTNGGSANRNIRNRPYRRTGVPTCALRSGGTSPQRRDQSQLPIPSLPRSGLVHNSLFICTKLYRN